MSPENSVKTADSMGGDEAKPTCAGCQARREVCEWGVRLSFRPENAQSMDDGHPSMRQATIHNKGQGFQVSVYTLLTPLKL